MNVRSAVGRFMARRPFWSVFPTPRLAAVVLGSGVLWLIPGPVGRIAAVSGLVAAALALGFDYLRLPPGRDVEVERMAPETLGLGDDAEFQYIVRSAWPWPVRV